MPKAMLAAVAGLGAVAAALAVVLGFGLFWLQAEDRAAIARVLPPVVAAPPPLAVKPPIQAATTKPVAIAPRPPAEKKAVAKAAAPKPIAPPKPAAPRAKVVEDPLAVAKKTLLDPAASLEKRQAAVAQLARTEAGATLLLQLTADGRLSAGLQQFAMDRLYQNAAALAGGVVFSP